MLPILTYHTIGDYEEVLPAGINTPIEVFRSHMHYLSKHQFRVCPLDRIVEHIISGRKPNRKTLAITFDDGYEDHFMSVYPILEMYCFPATIFLTVQYINGYWESERAEGGRIKALSKDQVLEMKKGGLIRFGSHGYSHRNLLCINEEEKVFEIRDSKSHLEGFLGEEVPFISYPFGAVNERVKNVVRESGYKAGFSIWNRKSDIYSIRRIPLHTHDYLMRFKFKVSPLYSITKSFFRFR
ncbi:MAG: polysaccharide deacetylase family protein [Candidatus Aenigmarchaeota archaeon]|nr:polysaccharide deacetylase family protein [Candidatus Aenigmarchaeota archaeon]